MSGPRRPCPVAIELEGVAIEIQTNCEATRQAIARQLAGFATAGAGPVSMRCTVEALAGGQYRLTDGRDEAVEGPWSRVLHFLRARLTAHWMAAWPDRVWLHASGVCDGAAAIVIAGPPGSGKSTLAAACVARGLHYLGDDTLPVDCDTGTVRPMPFAPAIRAGYAWWMTTDDFLLQEKTLRLPALARVRRAPARVTRLVMPVYDPTAACPQIDRLSTVDAVAALLPQCLNRHRFDRPALIERLIDRVRNTPRVLRARYADVETLAARLVPVTAECGDPTLRGEERA